LEIYVCRPFGYDKYKINKLYEIQIQLIISYN